MNEKKKPDKHKIGIKTFIILVIVIIAIIAGISYYIYYSSHYEYTDDAYIGGHYVFIAPQIAGYVKNIHVSDNEHVKENQLLLEVDPRPFKFKLDENIAQVEVAESEVEVAKSLYEISIDAQNTAAIDMYRNQLLATTSAISQEKFEHSIALYQAAKSAVKSQQASIKLAESKLDEARVNVSQAELKLSYTKIYSPSNGYITKKNVVAGSYLEVGNPLMAIVLDDKWINANFKETQLNNIRVGQKTEIVIDAYPEITFKGHVQSIQAGTGSVFSLLPPENATGNFVKVVQRVPVKIVFEEMPDVEKYFLALGLSVEPTVTIK